MATQGIVAKATSRGNLLFQSFPSHHSKAASVLATAMAAFDAVGFFEQLGDQQLSEQLLKEEREEEMKQNALEHHRWEDELAKGLTSLTCDEWQEQQKLKKARMQLLPEEANPREEQNTAGQQSIAGQQSMQITVGQQSTKGQQSTAGQQSRQSTVGQHSTCGPAEHPGQQSIVGQESTRGPVPKCYDE